MMRSTHLCILLVGAMLAVTRGESRRQQPRPTRLLPRATWKALGIQGGGGGGGRTTNRLTHPPAVTVPSKQQSMVTFPTKKTTVILLAATITTVSLVYWRKYPPQWLELFNKKKLLDSTLKILNQLDEQPKAVSYTTYMLGMAIWETLGLSTIPIETASGMVFGWPGFVLSAVGKLLGAVLAFCLARHSSLASWIQKKLSTNEVLNLLEDSAASHPLQVAFLMKLSCFPETIKNYGSALLFPIQLWMFVLATIVHGGLFSALWTYTGVDMAKRLDVTSLPTDKTLQFLLTLALINGFLVSPLAMAYWLKSVRGAKQKHATTKNRSLPWRLNVNKVKK